MEKTSNNNQKPFLLQYDGSQRLSAVKAMRHPFLQCLPDLLFRLADTVSI